MPQRKPYNPNTAYGRRKIREEHQRYRESLPKEEREKLEASSNFWSCLVIVLIIVIALVIGIATGNEKGVLKWLSR